MDTGTIFRRVDTIFHRLDTKKAGKPVIFAHKLSIISEQNLNFVVIFLHFVSESPLFLTNH